ncbi:hypothetical protein Ancab_000321 [Ancistrocladus abbreviatus]
MGPRGYTPELKRAKQSPQINSKPDGLVRGERYYKEALVCHNNGVEVNSSSAMEERSYRLNRIVASILVLVEGSSFIVNVFEQSIGETIFSRGRDCPSVVDQTYPTNEEFNVTNLGVTGCRCSVSSVEKVYIEKLALRENSIDDSKKVISNTPKYNDDRPSCNSGLG